MKVQPPRASPPIQTRARVRIGGLFWSGEQSRLQQGEGRCCEVEPNLGLLPHHPCRWLVGPPTPPTPRSTPAATARQLWTWSFRPGPCPGGRRCLCAQSAGPSRLPPGHPCQRQHAAVSSPWRMDFTLRRESGLSKPAPTLSLSRTLSGTEPWRGI